MRCRLETTPELERQQTLVDRSDGTRIIRIDPDGSPGFCLGWGRHMGTARTCRCFVLERVNEKTSAIRSTTPFTTSWA